MITLVAPPGLKSFSGLQMHVPNPPLGLAYVAGAVRASGRAVAVVDGTGLGLDRVSPYPGRADFLMQGLSFEEIVARIPASSTVIGISCMFSTQWPLSRMLAEAIRAAFPEALMVAGGEHATAVPEVVLASGRFDVVVLGEGEDSFLALLEAHEQGRPFAEVAGLAFPGGNTGLSPRRREVDSLPWPAWDLFPIEDYIARHQTNGVNLGRSMPILSTRGCPYRCTFCSNEGMWTTRYVPRSPKLVVDEMEHYVRTYNVSNFDFQDLTAVVKRSWALEFCRELTARGLNVTWQMPSGTRSEVFDAEVAAAMVAAGCRVLAFAPESGSPEVLKAVGKQVDLAALIEAAKIALAAGLKLSCFIVIGFPEDTPDTLRQTMRLVRRLALIGVHDIAVTKFVPYPGSPLFRRLQAEGRIQLNDAFFESPMDFYTSNAPSYSPAVSSRRLYFTMLWGFTCFYLLSFARRPWRVAWVLWNAVIHGREETRYAKWLVDRLHTRRRWRKLQGDSPSG